MVDRKEQILDIASELLTTRSYTSFSYHDLSERLGIRKASIHYHFPTKETLGVALTERFLEVYKSALAEIDKAHQEPWERLEAYLAILSQITKSGGICSVGVLQAELNVIPESVRKGQAALSHLLCDWLAKVLAGGRAQGVMDFPGKPEHQSAFLMAALQGALQNGRSDGSEALAVIINQIGKNLKPRRKG